MGRNRRVSILYSAVIERSRQLVYNNSSVTAVMVASRRRGVAPGAPSVEVAGKLGRKNRTSKRVGTIAKVAHTRVASAGPAFGSALGVEVCRATDIEYALCRPRRPGLASSPRRSACREVASARCELCTRLKTDGKKWLDA